MATQTVNTSTRQTKPIPHIQEPPLIGSLPEHNRDRLNLYQRVARECGDVGIFHFGPYPLILFNTSEFVQSILVEHAYGFDKGELLHKTFRPVIGNGLFISEGDLHRRQRKLMAPPFQPRHIKSYAASMVDYGERIQQEWRDESIVDIGQEMTHLTICTFLRNETHPKTLSWKPGARGWLEILPLPLAQCLD